MKKKIISVLLLVVIFMFMFMPIVQCDTVGDGFHYGFIPHRTVSSTLKTPFDNIWATAIIVLQVASVAAVVISGVRYMFASSDQKADIKKGLTYIVIGAVLVFGATTIIGVVTGTFNQLLVD